MLKSLTPRIEKLIAQTLKVQEPPARAHWLSPEPGPSNDPRFTTGENSATHGQRARRKRGRAKKARRQARPPSKRNQSGSSHIEADHLSRPQAHPKRAHCSPSPDSSLEHPDLLLK